MFGKKKKEEITVPVHYHCEASNTPIAIPPSINSNEYLAKMDFARMQMNIRNTEIGLKIVKWRHTKDTQKVEFSDGSVVRMWACDCPSCLPNED